MLESRHGFHFTGVCLGTAKAITMLEGADAIFRIVGKPRRMTEVPSALFRARPFTSQAGTRTRRAEGVCRTFAPCRPPSQEVSYDRDSSLEVEASKP